MPTSGVCNSRAILRVLLALPADAAYVAVARALASATLSRLGVIQSDIDDVSLVLGETCTNVVRHAHLHSGSAYTVTIECSAEQVVVTVTDTGRGFDRASVPPPDPDQLGGRGLWIVERLADQVQFTRVDDAATTVRACLNIHYETPEARQRALSLERQLADLPAEVQLGALHQAISQPAAVRRGAGRGRVGASRVLVFEAVGPSTRSQDRMAITQRASRELGVPRDLLKHLDALRDQVQASGKRATGQYPLAIGGAIPAYAYSLEPVRGRGGAVVAVVATVQEVGTPVRGSKGGAVGKPGAGEDSPAQMEHLRQVEQRLRERVRQQAVVAELGQRALGSTDLPALMDAVAEAVTSTLGVEYCKILELLPSGDRMLLRAGRGWRKGLVGHATVSADAGSQAGYALLSAQPVIVDDIRTDTRLRSPKLLRDHGVVSGISVIVHGPDAPFGVLGAHTSQRRTFTSDDVNFVQAVANVLAAAIQRSRSEQAIAELLAREQAARAAAEDAQRRHAFLAEAGALLASSLEYDQAVTSVARLAVPQVADCCAVHLVERAGMAGRVEVECAEPEKARVLRQLWQRSASDGSYPAGIATVLQTGEPRLIHAVTEADLPAYAANGQLEALRGLGLRSVIVVPLIARGRPIGTVTLATMESGRRYQAEDLVLAQELAHRAALAIENSTLYKQSQDVQRRLSTALQSERDLVGRLTESFQGHTPELPGLQIASLYQPALKAERVGGDYYDFIRVDDSRVALVIGDVCGKGLGAALYTAMAKNMLRAYALEDPEPHQVLRRLNRALYSEMQSGGMFVTLFYGLLDLRSATLTYADAGHPPPVLLDAATRSCHRLQSTGGVVGAFPDMPFGQRTAPLPPGSVLAMFTDGVTEADRSPRHFADGGVSAILRRHGHESAAAIANRILAHARKRANGDLRDDVAVVVVRRPPEGELGP